MSRVGRLQAVADAALLPAAPPTVGVPASDLCDLLAVVAMVHSYLRVVDETAGGHGYSDVGEARRVARGHLREALFRLEGDC